MEVQAASGFAVAGIALVEAEVVGDVEVLPVRAAVEADLGLHKLVVRRLAGHQAGVQEDLAVQLVRQVHSCAATFRLMAAYSMHLRLVCVTSGGKITALLSTAAHILLHHTRCKSQLGLLHFMGWRVTITGRQDGSFIKQYEAARPCREV